MNFVERIFDHLEQLPSRATLIEVHGERLVPFDGKALLGDIAKVRGFLHTRGVKPGDRVALLAPNSARWVCADLGVIASGAITVPLYDKQAPAELAIMMRSAEPVLSIAATDTLRDSLAAAWPEHGTLATFDEVFASEPITAPLHPIEASDPVAIIYTSGTSGLPKGVVLSRANIDFMIPQTIARLALVPGGSGGDRVFHFLPFCFAASRMMMWTQLSRPNPLMISTDLTNLVEEMDTAKPEYFLNVPAVLERIRAGVGNKVRERGGIAASLYARGVRAEFDGAAAGVMDRLALALAKRVVFPRIKTSIGPNLRFLISGSAPLAEETQRWFGMLGIPVYQAYGLTETTGIVSLDLPDRTVPGRVGVALDGVTTKITGDGELCVQGDNIFPGYWNLKDETDKVLRDGWFHTGDQVEMDDGNLKIVGRIKHLIIPESGHNIAPEPLEERFLSACPSVTQCMVVGHARAFVAVLVVGAPDVAAVDAAIEAVNAPLPSYRKIRKAIHVSEPFTPENGLLTANQKLRRAAIEKHFAAAIDAGYAARS